MQHLCRIGCQRHRSRVRIAHSPKLTPVCTARREYLYTRTLEDTYRTREFLIKAIALASLLPRGDAKGERASALPPRADRSRTTTA